MENNNSRLKQLRLERGLTIQNMAEVLGLSQGSYNYYELGKTEPNIATLKKLADYFCVSIDYLVGAEVRGKSLNADEVELLKYYRAVDDTSKRATIKMLKSLYEDIK